jgi:anion-transporting  ArsA/GET3 family ATPase
MSTLADKRFVLVTGKGGVGKTTFCAAEASALAASGKRVLVAMCNAKERLSGLFASAPIGHAVTPVADRVWAVNIVPEKAIEEYGFLVLRNRVLAKALFDSKYVRAFLRAVPGMHEWATLGKAWWHTTETLADGSLKYDVVILDAPATGHGLDMLRVPTVILDVVPPGLLRRDAERAWALFRDPNACAIVVVTLPEEMPITETIELCRSLAQMGLSVRRVVANGVLPALFTDAERTMLEALPSFEAHTPGDAAILAAKNRAAREHLQAEMLARLAREVSVRPVQLPLLVDDATGPLAVSRLAACVSAWPDAG